MADAPLGMTINPFTLTSSNTSNGTSWPTFASPEETVSLIRVFMGVPSRSVLGEGGVAGCGAAAGKAGAGTASWATALVAVPALKATPSRTQEQIVTIVFIMNNSS
jgi:hypothetical protein